MSEALRSVLPSATILGMVAALAVYLAATRHRIVGAEPERRAWLRIAVVAVLFQSVHFAEEYASGFDARFPALFGLAPMSPVFFASFNGFWLALWGLSLWAVVVRPRLALFPLWFLGIACALNGLAHPLLALRSGGYFPGLITSPLVGVAGVLLLWRTLRVTAPGR